MDINCYSSNPSLANTFVKSSLNSIRSRFNSNLTCHNHVHGLFFGNTPQFHLARVIAIVLHAHFGKVGQSVLAPGAVQYYFVFLDDDFNVIVSDYNSAYQFNVISFCNVQGRLDDQSRS